MASAGHPAAPAHIPQRGVYRGKLELIGSAGGNVLPFITQRIVILAALLIVLSIVSFILIELPPGDFLTTLRGAPEGRRL